MGGGQILPQIRKENPGYRYVSTESECGNGDMDWKAAEHTFRLINHYIGNGCSDYFNWNLILPDRGESRWGWKQNALVRVNSADRSYEYVPEWFAYRHYSNFITEGTKITGHKPAGDDKTPVLTALTPEETHCCGRQSLRHGKGNQRQDRHAISQPDTRAAHLQQLCREVTPGPAATHCIP